MALEQIDPGEDSFWFPQFNFANRVESDSQGFFQVPRVRQAPMGDLLPFLAILPFLVPDAYQITASSSISAKEENAMTSIPGIAGRLLAMVLGVTIVVASNPAGGRALRFVESEVDTPPLTPTALALSPDGRHVYVTSSGKRTFFNIIVQDQTVGALSVFEREPDTGDLRFVEAYFDDIGDDNGLSGAASVNLSPDGRHVYVLGLPLEDRYPGPATLAVFRRNGISGHLTPIQTLREGDAGIVELSGPPAMTADGRHFYAGQSVFERDASSGTLSLILTCSSEGAAIECLSGSGTAASGELDPAIPGV